MFRSFLVASLLTLPAVAHANPDPDGDGRVGVTAVESALGPSIGFEVTPVFSRHVEVGLGAAVGNGGPEATLMPRARYTAGRVTVTLGAGVSVGGFGVCTGECSNAIPVKGRAEVGAQLTLAGLFARGYVGVDHQLLPTYDMMLVQDGSDHAFAGLTIGKAF